MQTVETERVPSICSQSVQRDGGRKYSGRIVNDKDYKVITRKLLNIQIGDKNGASVHAQNASYEWKTWEHQGWFLPSH